MLYSDLQARATTLAQFEGWADTVPAPNWPQLVNYGWAQFSWDAECYITTSTADVTAAGVVDYFLTGGPWKTFLDVLVNGQPCRRSDEEFERFWNPGWRVTTGTPARWCMSNFGTLSLVPVPGSANLPISVRGVTEGPPMVLSTDAPGVSNGTGNPIPDVFHEGVAWRAAWLQGIVYAQGEALPRLQAFETRYQEWVAKCFEATKSGGYDRRSE